MNRPEKLRARISAGEMAYVDAGDPEAPPVLLLHGFPTSSYLWREFVPLFAPWMRVIVPDLIGAGDSDMPAEADLRITAQARYVREMLDGLGIGELAVVGHSHGGGIAQLLALEDGVRTMILVDAIAFDAWPSEPFRELQASVPPTVSDPAIVRAVLRTGFQLGMGHDSRLGEAVLEEYVRPYADADPAAFFRFVRALDGVGLAGIEQELGRLECPTLILWGEDDPFLPVEVAERLNEAVPGSSLALLPGCSHFLPEDAPETIAPLMLEYLRSRYLGRSHTHGEPGGPVPIELRRGSPESEVS